MKKILLITFGVIILLWGASLVYAATFGNTNVEIGVFDVGDWIQGSVFTMPENGTVTKISVNEHVVLNPESSKVAIYQGTTLIATSNTVTVSGSTYTWYDYTISASLTGGTAYSLVVWSSFLNDGVEVHEATTGGTGKSKSLVYTGTFPNPITWAGDTTKLYSIYATYTPSGGGGGATTNPSNTVLFE